MGKMGAMAKKPDRWVSKAVALRILAELRRCTPSQFRTALLKKRFEMGSKTRVNNILHRLKSQGLIQRSVEKHEMKPYKLKTRDGSKKMVTRSQDFVTWALTPRGQQKIEYYDGAGR